MASKNVSLTSPPTAVDLSIRNTLSEGFDDVFGPPLFLPSFEQKALKEDKALQESLRKSTVKAIQKPAIQQMFLHPVENILLPKSRFTLRKCSAIDPADHVKFLSLVLQIAEQIEANRAPKSDNVVFSYRFLPRDNGQLFDPDFNYSTFREQSKKLASKKGVTAKVITDISNFYDRLNLHRLESTLYAIGCDPNIVKKLNDLLISWSNKDSYGLPVGGNASRILAEAALIDVDGFLRDKGINYIRFVDDFRFFATDFETAHYWLSLIGERLYRDGLALNEKKTHILEAHNEEPQLLITDLHSSQEGSAGIRSFDNDKNDIKQFVHLYKKNISISYKSPSDIEMERLRNLDVPVLHNNLMAESDPSQDVLKDFIRASILKYDIKNLEKLFDVIKRYPEHIPYAVDVILKNREDLHPNSKKAISHRFSDWLGQGLSFPDYIVLAFSRILTHEHFNNYEKVLHFYHSMPRKTPGYIGREILLRLGPHLNREQMLQIRDSYSRSTLWEKRAILKVLIDNKAIHNKEKQPWIKNLETFESDPLISSMANTFLKQ